VQANIADRQLQIMPHIDLVSDLSALRVNNEWGISVGTLGGAGRAKEEVSERHNKVKRIIFGALVPSKYHQGA